MSKSNKIKEKEIQKIIILKKNKQFIRAKKEALKCLKQEENNLKILKLLAVLSSSLDEVDNEERYLLKLLSINSKDADIYNDLGNFYKKIGQYSKAKESYLNAIKFLPENGIFYGNLALIFNDLKEYQNADEMYKEAIARDTKNKTLLVNYSMFLLKQQRYLKGFEYFRYRYDDDKDDRQAKLLAPEGLLQKHEDIRDKIIFLSDEQGAGDVVQFMRYIPLYESLAKKVYINPRNLLKRLIMKTYPSIELAKGNMEIDYHIPIADSAYYFGTEYGTIPFKDKYIDIDKNESYEIFNKYFNKVNKKKVGIVWRSNPTKNESLSKQKQREKRNCKLIDFIKYFNNENIQLFSMQVSVTDEERDLLQENNIPSLGDNLIDFYDNALIIDNLDLLISIDTISGLIAGAMGKKTIMLLSYTSDWRWGATSDTTNWFKSIKLFRQDKEDSWEKIYQEISNFDGLFNNISSINQALKMAVEYHNLNQLKEAEELYKKILLLDPNNYDACHYLGVLAYQTGYVEQAVKLIYEAVKINPDLIEAHKNLQEILLSKNESFVHDYLDFRDQTIDINKFAIRSKKHNLSEEEKILIYSIKMSIDMLQADDFTKSTILLYISMLENNFIDGIKKYVNTNLDIETKYKRLGRLYDISSIQNFHTTKDEQNVVALILKENLDDNVYSSLSVKNKYFLLNNFLKFLELFNDIFEPYFKNNIYTLIEQLIEYNHGLEEIFFRNNLKELKEFFYYTATLNPLLLETRCRVIFSKEIENIYEKATLLKKKYYSKLSYVMRNLFMHWYTSLRDASDIKFIGTKYILLINDTSDHYHPGCFMTSSGIKEMLVSKNQNIIDIPIHEINSNGKLFDLTQEKDFDNEKNYLLFKDKLSIMEKKIANAQEIVINGEGTLHGKAKHVLFLLYLAYISKIKYNKKISIINHSPYPSYHSNKRDKIADLIYKKVYNKVDFIGIREPIAQTMMDELGIKSTLTFDCSSIYLSKVEQKSLLNMTPYTEYIVISSSVIASHHTIEVFQSFIIQQIKKGQNIVLFCGGPYEEKVFLDKVYKGFEDEKKVSLIETKSVEHFLSIIKNTKLLISGRFHYSIVSIFLHSPFILLSSNTAKNIGLLQMGELPNKLISYKSENLLDELKEETLKVLANKDKYVLGDDRLKVLVSMAKNNVL